LISAFLMLGSICCRAQEADLSVPDILNVTDTQDTLSQTKQKKGLIKWFVNWRDKSLVSGCDTSYIIVPKKKWTATTGLKSTGNAFRIYWPTSLEMAMKGNPGKIFSENSYIFEHKTIPTLGVSIGLCYKGFGLTVSPKVINNNKEKGLDIGLGLTGTTLGGDVALKYLFDTDQDNNSYFLLAGSLSAYYVLNNKKFNMSSAFSQSVLQKKSAGSVVFATMLDFSSIISAHSNHSEIKDGSFALHSDWSLGVGYGYNLVFAQSKCLIHASYIPMLMILQNSTYGILKGNEQTQKLESESVKADKKYSIPYSHLARFAFYYTWRERYLVGGSLQDSHYGWANSDARPNYGMEWTASIFFKFRF